MTTSNLAIMSNQDNSEGRNIDYVKEKKFDKDIAARKVKLNNSGIPGVFNCRFANAAVVNPNRKKKKPTTFVPPPPPQDQSTSTVTTTTAIEDTKQWLNGNNGHQQLIPFWKKAVSFSNASQSDDSSIQKNTTEAETGSSLSVNLIREKLRQKKQQQLLLNQQPPPSKKLHTSPNTILFTSPSILSDGDEGVGLTSWPPVKMHCLLPPPPVSPYHSNSHSSSLWKVSQREKSNVPEILLAPRCLPIHCAHWTPPGHLNHSRNGKGESSKDESEEGEISDMEGSQVSLPRSYTLPREFKYYHSTNMLRDKERCGGPSKAQPSRFYLPSTYSSDGDVDSADNEEETDSELQVVMKEGHNCSSDRMQQRKYALKNNEGAELSSNNCDASTDVAISNNIHHNNLYGILRPNQLFKARKRNEGIFNKNTKIFLKSTTTIEKMKKEELHIPNEDIKSYNWHSKGNMNTGEKTHFDRNHIHMQDEKRIYQDHVINACTVGNLNVIEEYLNDHDVNDFLYTGWTPLLYAASSCNAEVIKYLLTHGADSNKHRDGFTPLMALCNSTRGTTENCLHCLSLLIEASANTEATNKEKQTALMYTCKTKDVQVVRELIKHVKNINACDNEGQTALIYAVLTNKLETVKLLLENEASATIKNRRHQTAKDVADSKGYDKISLLLSSEDDVLITYEVSQIEEWRDMFPRLCLNKDQVVDHDIVTILYGMGLENYTNLFQGMELQRFLQLTEKDLLHLGIDISVHRNKFLNHLYKFHCKTWGVHTIGVINKSQPYTLYSGISSMGNVTKQILVMNSTFRYIKSNLDNVSYKNIFANDVQISEYKETIESTKKALTNLKKELLNVKALADKINAKSCLPVPPCYIGPKKTLHLICKPIVWSILLVCGICLVKVRVYK
ncbi:hypothetical protein KPH14_003273 [Odynerus spinipes]|uniref:SAM domain-containing protein n=1 Tax=Odynerus spinipes TaxID=1348599 RepID=A0AAD9RH59_9HYME|nr:hypothetical protein KPH14_003273 [Odynerus spinipes]